MLLDLVRLSVCGNGSGEWREEPYLSFMHFNSQCAFPRSEVRSMGMHEMDAKNGPGMCYRRRHM